MAPRTITQEWLESLSVAQLEAELRRHNRLYWDEHKPEISDYDYDRIVNRLKHLSPKSAVLDEMGASAPKLGVATDDSAPPVRHKARMLSLDKCYSHDELAKWGATFEGKVMVSPKFDGIACSLHYDERGELELAATRGDGATGENITANARVIADIPSKLAKGARRVEVRGEIFMRVSVFERYKAEGFANPRNLAAGAIKQKDVAKSKDYGLSFAAYDLVGTDHETEHEKMDALSEMGFVAIEKRVLSKGEMVAAYEDMAARRSKLDFEIDGVVFKADSTREQRRLGATSHHPRYAIAYKFQGDSGSTIVREIEWSVSRSGAITPVALIDPVTLSGATVSRASLHNVSFIDKLSLSKNATVIVMRRGGVIPNVEFVSKPGDVPFELPASCPSCGGAVRREGDFIFCDKPRECRSSVIGQLSHYADVVGILGFGDSVLAGAFDRGLLRRPADFYGLTERKLVTLDRMGTRLAKRLLREIDRARQLDLATFLRAFGMHEVGKLVSELLAQRFETLERIYEVDEVELATIPRIGPTIARAVVKSLREAKPEIEEARRFVEIVALTDRPAASAAEVSRSGVRATLAGLSFVFTGSLATMRRAEAERMVKDRGGVAQDNVTKTLDYLVVGEHRTDEKSSKEKIAEKFIEAGAKIQVISERDFLAQVKEADARAGDAPPEPAATALASTVESSAPTPRPSPALSGPAPTSASASSAPAPSGPREPAPPAALKLESPRAPASAHGPTKSKPLRASDLAPRELKDDPEPDRRKEDPMLLALLGGIRARTAPKDDTGEGGDDS
jgi:DNA ligase (NAD+)